LITCAEAAGMKKMKKMGMKKMGDEEDGGWPGNRKS